MKNFATKAFCSLFIIIIMLLPFLGYMLREFRISEGRKMLPKDATKVEEFLIHGILGGDYTRVLKASLAEEQYSIYAKSLGITERFDHKRHQSIESRLNMRISEAPEWWNPPLVDSQTYFEHKDGDDYLRVLRYHDGFVYLLVSSW